MPIYSRIVHHTFDTLEFFRNWLTSQAQDIVINLERAPILKAGQHIVIKEPNIVIYCIRDIQKVTNIFLSETSDQLNLDSDTQYFFTYTSNTYKKYITHTGNNEIFQINYIKNIMVGQVNLQISPDIYNSLQPGDYIDIYTTTDVTLQPGIYTISSYIHNALEEVTGDSLIYLEDYSYYKLIFFAANIALVRIGNNSSSSNLPFYTPSNNILRKGVQNIMNLLTDGEEYTLSCALATTDPQYETAIGAVYGFKCFRELTIRIPENDSIDSISGTNGVESRNNSGFARLILPYGSSLQLVFWKTGTREGMPSNHWILRNM